MIIMLASAQLGLARAWQNQYFNKSVVLFDSFDFPSIIFEDWKSQVAVASVNFWLDLSY